MDGSKRISQRFFVLGFLGMFLGLPALMAAPLDTGFTYQGQLTLTGSAVTGNYDFEVRLYDADVGGSQLGTTATLLAVSVQGGIFAMLLDFGLPVFEADEALWLEISVRPSGTTNWTDLTPRQPLTPAPYALRSQSQAWDGLTDVPSGFADQVDNDALTSLSCAAGQVPSWNGSSWSCTTTNSGDITSVLPSGGCGITGGATSGDALLCLDFGTVQQRVSGTCPPGQAIRQINADGSVACTVPTSPDYEVTSDSGWFSVPARSSLEIDLGNEEFDFVFGVIRGADHSTGPIYQPIMGAAYHNFLRAYVGLSDTAATVYNYQYSGDFQNLGDWGEVILDSAEMRLAAIKRTPDYDSSWTECSVGNGGNNYIFNHGLGVVPEFAMVEVAENNDGSGWRMPTMISSNIDNSGSRQANIVALNSQSVTLRTQGSLVRFRDTSGTTVTATEGFCRVQLFSWAPDYDSGWEAISTSSGDRDKWFRHGLGVRPRVFMLWIAENADGSGWRIPALSNVQRHGSHGTQVYNLTEDWVTIKGGATFLAQFTDSGGASQAVSSGFIRFMAWE